MTLFSWKGPARSDEPTENYHPVPLSSPECFSISQLIVLISRLTTVLFSLTTLRQVVVHSEKALMN